MSMTHTASATGLLAQVAQGDPRAVRECIDRFGPLLWSLARRLTPNQSEAEDAVQEILLEIWKNASRYDPSIASETTFVAMLARRRLIDRARRSARRSEREMPIGEMDAVAGGLSADERAGDISSDGDASRAVEALSQLSAEQQKILRLSIYRGLSHEKISRAIGLPLGTVKTHARRGLLKLREMLMSGSGGGERPAHTAASGKEGHA